MGSYRAEGGDKNGNEVVRMGRRRGRERGGREEIVGGVTDRKENGRGKRGRAKGEANESYR